MGSCFLNTKVQLSNGGKNQTNQVVVLYKIYSFHNDFQAMPIFQNIGCNKGTSRSGQAKTY